MILFASLRSMTRPADFRTPRCREIDGALIVKWDAISPHQARQLAGPGESAAGWGRQAP
jgi:hypothetical protein